mgnify:FL=1|jgi:hypothetical protein
MRLTTTPRPATLPPIELQPMATASAATALAEGATNSSTVAIADVATYALQQQVRPSRRQRYYEWRRRVEDKAQDLWYKSRIDSLCNSISGFINCHAQGQKDRDIERFMRGVANLPERQRVRPLESFAEAITTIQEVSGYDFESGEAKGSLQQKVIEKFFAIISTWPDEQRALPLLNIAQSSQHLDNPSYLFNILELFQQSDGNLLCETDSHECIMAIIHAIPKKISEKSTRQKDHILKFLEVIRETDHDDTLLTLLCDEGVAKIEDPPNKLEAINLLLPEIEKIADEQRKEAMYGKVVDIFIDITVSYPDFIASRTPWTRINILTAVSSLLSTAQKLPPSLQGGLFDVIPNIIMILKNPISLSQAIQVFIETTHREEQAIELMRPIPADINSAESNRLYEIRDYVKTIKLLSEGFRAPLYEQAQQLFLKEIAKISGYQESWKRVSELSSTMEFLVELPTDYRGSILKGIPDIIIATEPTWDISSTLERLAAHFDPLEEAERLPMLQTLCNNFTKLLTPPPPPSRESHYLSMGTDYRKKQIQDYQKKITSIILDYTAKVADDAQKIELFSTVLNAIPTIRDIHTQLATMTLLVPHIADTDALCERAAAIMTDTAPTIMTMESFYDIYTAMIAFFVAVNTFPEAVRGPLLFKMTTDISDFQSKDLESMSSLRGAFFCAIDSEEAKDIHDDIVLHLGETCSSIYQNPRLYLDVIGWFLSECPEELYPKQIPLMLKPFPGKIQGIADIEEKVRSITSFVNVISFLPKTVPDPLHKSIFDVISKTSTPIPPYVIELLQSLTTLHNQEQRQLISKLPKKL